MSKRTIKKLVLVCLAALLLTGCGKGKNESLRQAEGENLPVIYLGMPRELETEADYKWISSDESIAHVDNNLVVGVKEGTVELKKVKANGKTEIESQKYVVTTFNDGKQADINYEFGREGYEDMGVNDCFSLNPEYLKTKINTIQDAIGYFQAKRFYIYGDTPILVSDSDWLWTISGETVLLENRGGTAELLSAVLYLLENDFEDWGYIKEMGEYEIANIWFLEDGNYYFFNFRSMLLDFREEEYEKEYQVLKFSSLDEFKEYYAGTINKEKVFAAVMIPMQGHIDIPAVYYSYMHDSSVVHTEKSIVKFEDDIYDRLIYLYENHDFDYSIESVPTEEMPLDVPVYGERTICYSYN